MKAFEISGVSSGILFMSSFAPGELMWVSSMNLGRENFICWIWGSKGMKIALT
jgi:hypothetical protein